MRDGQRNVHEWRKDEKKRFMETSGRDRRNGSGTVFEHDRFGGR